MKGVGTGVRSGDGKVVVGDDIQEKKYIFFSFGNYIKNFFKLIKLLIMKNEISSQKKNFQTRIGTI
jgi:hypothetical protein